MGKRATNWRRSDGENKGTQNGAMDSNGKCLGGTASRGQLDRFKVKRRPVCGGGLKFYGTDGKGDGKEWAVN
ncbi:MAG: hypothetical protein WAK48_12310 [Candidatus Acidiferrum sp.]